MSKVLLQWELVNLDFYYVEKYMIIYQKTGKKFKKLYGLIQFFVLDQNLNCSPQPYFDIQIINFGDSCNYLIGTLDNSNKHSMYYVKNGNRLMSDLLASSALNACNF